MAGPLLQGGSVASGLRAALLLLVVLGLAVVVGPRQPASADHGSWTRHYLTVFESGPSNYGGYAELSASDAYDYGYGRFQVERGYSLIIDESFVCGPINEGCGYRKTTTRYWAQTSSYAQVRICGYDSSHALPASGSAADSRCGPYGIPVHHHGAFYN